jgi:hypothetical protein
MEPAKSIIPCLPTKTKEFRDHPLTLLPLPSPTSPTASEVSKGAWARYTLEVNSPLWGKYQFAKKLQIIYAVDTSKQRSFYFFFFPLDKIYSRAQ